MQNVIELVFGLALFHSLLSVWESFRDFQPTTKTKQQRFYTGRCLDQKGKVVI